MTRLLASLSVALAAASLAVTNTHAAPTSSSPASTSSLSRSIEPQHHAITRRSPGYKNLRGDELIAWTEANTARLRAKYASKLKSSTRKREQSDRRKRDTAGSASLVNYENDSVFYSTVDVGTPSQGVTVILDTGSSDFWVVQGRNSWAPSESSTFVNSTTAFAISYGSGDVSGVLATDTVSLAGHTSSSQTFAIATAVTSGLLESNIDGIMGFGFESLSTSKSTPFWQASGADQFAFYLKTSSDQTAQQEPQGPTPPSDATSSSSSSSSSSTTYSSQESDGGIFTLGGTNTSLYQGDINWSDVSDEAYWLITLGGISIGGNDVSLSGTSKTAVDTGTTLIGAPTSVVEAIYSQISGSSPLSGTSSEYYQYPCSTTVNATIHLGDQEYSLSGDSFQAGTVDSAGEYCMGAFFSIGSDSSDELQYILGDAFLTQVYTIFDNSASTARVGFASLADGLGTTTNSSTVSKVVTSSGGSQIVPPSSLLWTSSILLVALASIYSTIG